MENNKEIEKDKKEINDEEMKNKNIFDAIEDSFRDSAWKSWESGSFRW
ncbi:hypothetical protein [Clostridium botulinum]|uniref:Uncharacterized protein n=1 Tax=Clostridium botulinum (strain 657 / Type Ba4) TaxID=515621 RepID=A0A3F2ZR04_CLOB6|nr:hypothetical protein [Clostridium botulinum]ACQ51193.1 hypothetical protein CLJ_0266 [Clostridium botulinum Ba4 str. 657]